MFLEKNSLEHNIHPYGITKNKLDDFLQSFSNEEQKFVCEIKQFRGKRKYFKFQPKIFQVSFKPKYFSGLQVKPQTKNIDY